MNAGVVAALATEARALGSRRRRPDGLFATPAGTLIAISGMGEAAAARAARRLARSGVTALVSWGVAGGLDPTLRAGTICIPARVLRGSAVFDTDEAWCRAAGAAAVDMESAAIAQVAADRGLPFMAVRVVLDTASDPVPAAVSRASRGESVSIARLLFELLRAPAGLLPVLRLARGHRAALRALRSVARSGALTAPAARDGAAAWIA